MKLVALRLAVLATLCSLGSPFAYADYQYRVALKGLLPSVVAATPPAAETPPVAEAPPVAPAQLTVINAANQSSTWSAADGPLVLATPGEYRVTTSQTTTVTAKLWGAAGGTSSVSGTTCRNPGGAGGYIGGTVTLSAGVTYYIWVGAGGGHPADGADFGGGGLAGNSGTTSQMGNGGGLTGLFSGSVSQGNVLLVAGGGGGGAGDGSSTSKLYGGGSSGQDGYDSTNNARPGKGGTTTKGGDGGLHASGYGVNGSPGAALQGGAYPGTSYAAAGGGAGYFGGGAGGGNNTVGESGGGGSSFAAAGVGGVTQLDGNFTVPGNSGDADRGNAGTPVPNSTVASRAACNGAAGRLVFR